MKVKTPDVPKILNGDIVKLGANDIHSYLVTIHEGSQYALTSLFDGSMIKDSLSPSLKALEQCILSDFKTYTLYSRNHYVLEVTEKNE